MQEQQEKLLRLPQVFEIIPISRSAWWNGCREGKFPQPIKLGPKTTVWKLSEIQELLNRIGDQHEKEADEK